jgi:2-phospho-L-lactate guanylyltransferase
MNFRFGPGSFAAHLAEAEQAEVPIVAVNRAGLAFDLDTPEDLARWLNLGDAA